MYHFIQANREWLRLAQIFATTLSVSLNPVTLSPSPRGSGQIQRMLLEGNPVIVAMRPHESRRAGAFAVSPRPASG